MIEKLMIDEEFRTIIPPLTSDEYSNLERSLRSEGCRDAIRVWGDVIVDGHNRYEICQKWGISFQIIHLSFSSREEAISWICLNQLSRRNLTKEAYKYLIGKRYDAEKAACQLRNRTGKNQHSVDDLRLVGNNDRIIARWTSRRLADEYNLSHATVERYGEFSRSLDRIEKEKPGILSTLLSGRYRVSQQNLSTLSKMPKESMDMVVDKLREAENEKGAIPLHAASAIIAPEEDETHPAEKPHLEMKIKEMPAYNPDSEMNGLVLTIPTWIDMITRLTGVSVRCASGKAKASMMKALTDLMRAITRLQQEMEDAI